MANYHYIMLFCIICWSILQFLKSPKHLFNPNLYELAVLFYIFYTVIFAYSTNNDAIGNRYIELSIFPMYYLTYNKNRISGLDYVNKIIIIIVAPFVIVTGYFTINASRTQGISSRAAKRVSETGIEYLKSGIGGYEFIYFLLFVSVIILFIIFNKKININKAYELILLIFWLVFSYMIILSGYTMATILLVFSVVQRVIFSRINNYRIVGGTLLIFLSLIFFKDIISVFLNVLDYLAFNSQAQEKVVEINRYINNGFMGEALYSRYSVYNYSINAFFDSPFLGSMISSQGQNNFEVARFGNHSQIIDTFAFYGLGIGLLQLYVLFKPLFLRMHFPNSSYDILPISIIIIFACLTTLNVLTQSIGFVVFFIYFTVDDMVNKKGVVYY